jgi:hypothetical protein
MNCTTTRRVIDEADNPANLPYEAAGHLEGCGPCRQLAGEREQLRKLLLEPARVSAPANFEAMVARRLAVRTAERRPFWMATGFYLRAAGAAATLAFMILVIQVTRKPVVPSAAPPNVETIAIGPLPGVGSDRTPSVTPNGTGAVIGKDRNGGAFRRGYKRGLPAVSNTEATAVVARDLTEQPRAILLVRNSGSEREIAVPMVSVGAQPWLSFSLQPQDERGVRITF